MSGARVGGEGTPWQATGPPSLAAGGWHEAGHGWSWRPGASGPALFFCRQLGGAPAWGQGCRVGPGWGGILSLDIIPNSPSRFTTVARGDCTLRVVTTPPPLPRSEKQRWISAMRPSSSQEDKEIFSEGQGSSLPPPPASRPTSPFSPGLVPWCPRAVSPFASVAEGRNPSGPGAGVGGEGAAPLTQRLLSGV